MGTKQYHMAVFAEVDTETGEVLRVETDADVFAGAGTNLQVYDTGAEEWERIDYDHDPAAVVADAAISDVVRMGWRAFRLTHPQWYVLVVAGDVEPTTYGPFDTEAERDDWARRYRREQDNEGRDGVFALDVREDGRPMTFPYSAAFFEEA
jgi:hypothetical protein